MGNGLRIQAKRVFFQQVAPAYHRVLGSQKQQILEEFVTATGDELPYEEQKSASVLDWRRTSKDPFAGLWEQILAWVRTNPTRSSGDILQELQCLFPGRYERSHLRTLQRGIRKIRAYLLQAHEEAGSPQGPQGNVLPSAELKPCTGYLSHPFVQLAIRAFTHTHCSLSYGTRPWKEEGIFSCSGVAILTLP